MRDAQLCRSRRRVLRAVRVSRALPDLWLQAKGLTTATSALNAVGAYGDTAAMVQSSWYAMCAAVGGPSSDR